MKHTLKQVSNINKGKYQQIWQHQEVYCYCHFYWLFIMVSELFSEYYYFRLLWDLKWFRLRSLYMRDTCQNLKKNTHTHKVRNKKLFLNSEKWSSVGFHRSIYLAFRKRNEYLKWFSDAEMLECPIWITLNSLLLCNRIELMEMWTEIRTTLVGTYYISSMPVYC